MTEDAASYFKEMGILVAGKAGRSELPAEALVYDESVDPWEAFDRYLTAFQLMMGVRAGLSEIPYPFRKSPTQAIDKHCDEWLTTFLAADDRRLIVPPNYLIKWLATRAFAAAIFLELDKERGAVPPDMKDDLDGELEKWLVDLWHSRIKALWPMIDPKKGDPKYQGKQTGGRF